VFTISTAGDAHERETSILGRLIDRDGPSNFGAIMAELGDAAIVDSRVLLADRLGADERSWPSAEDRYASDLLLPERVIDPWLRELTASAAAAAIPIALGGHTLVGPGLRLALRPTAARRIPQRRRGTSRVAASSAPRLPAPLPGRATPSRPAGRA